jgi:hypothetical protein
VELRGAQRRPADARVLDLPLDLVLRAVVAERYDVAAEIRFRTASTSAPFFWDVAQCTTTSAPDVA